MREFIGASTVAARAGALPVLTAYAGLHAAVQQLVELDKVARAMADQPVAPGQGAAIERQEAWNRLNEQFQAAFAELTRVDADLATRRRAALDVAREAMLRREGIGPRQAGFRPPGVAAAASVGLS